MGQSSQHLLLKNLSFPLCVLQCYHCYISSQYMPVGNFLKLIFSLPRNSRIRAHYTWHVRQSPLRTRAWRAAAVVSTTPSSGRALGSVLLHRSSPLSRCSLFPHSTSTFPIWSFSTPLHSPLEHLHGHIWCLLRDYPGKQVARESQCKQVSPA